MVSALADLRGVLRQCGQALAMTLRRSDDFHLLPVIRKFSAAIETSNVCSRQSGSLGTPLLLHESSLESCNGRVCIQKPLDQFKNRINQFCNHDPTFHT